ncbi:MAG: hypothetical protein ABIR51_10025 [Sphingomicrobium sp.]
MWGCTRGRTPAARRTGYDLVRPAPPQPDAPRTLAERPALSPSPSRGEALDAFGEWLAHLGAGRIATR